MKVNDNIINLLKKFVLSHSSINLDRVLSQVNLNLTKFLKTEFLKT